MMEQAKSEAVGSEQTDGGRSSEMGGPAAKSPQT